MSASEEYLVYADLIVRHDQEASRKLAGVAQAADKASINFAQLGGAAAESLAGIGGALNGALNGITSLAVQGGTLLAGLATAGGVMALKTGLLDVNAKLEEANIGFATMFTMFGSASSMNQGLELSHTLIEGIRKDAAALPGEFGDFVMMAKTMTGPLAGMGKGIEDVRRVTRETVVTAASLGVEYQQASREMNMLLMGHAGGHNTFGNLLGIKADTKVDGKAWHDASQEERLAYIEKMMSKSNGALDLYKHSWSGLSSTMVDAVKQFLGVATGPLFERMKNDLWRIAGDGGLLEKYQGNVGGLAAVIGNKLVVAHDWVLAKVERVASHWQDIRDYIAHAGDELRHAWAVAEPMIAKLGGFLAKELADPGAAVHDMIRAKVLAMGLSAAPMMLQTGVMMSRMGGFGGGASAAAEVAAAGEGVASVAAPAAAGAEGAGIMSGLAEVAASAGPAAVALLALAGVVDLHTVKLNETTGVLHGLASVFKDMEKQIGVDAIAGFKELQKTLSDLWTAVQPIADLFGTALMISIDVTIQTFRLLLAPTRLLADGFSYLVSLIPGYEPKLKDDVLETDRTTSATFQNADRPSMQPEKPKLDTQKQVVDMRGAKIEIKLDAKNDAPDRIARRLFDAMGKAVARPVSSPYAPARAY